MDNAERPVMGRWFEDLTPGLVIDHAVTRTITEADNTLFSVLTMNAAAAAPRRGRSPRPPSSAPAW